MSFSNRLCVGLFAILTLASGLSWAQTESTKIQGVLLERGTQVPLGEVSVFLLPLKQKTTTNQKGEFEFSEIPVGTYQLVVNHSGYLRYEKELQVQGAGAASSRYFLEREKYQGFETTVTAKKDARDLTKKSLGQSEFLSMPGAGGDPVKAVQNLPGINRVAGFSSNVVIQGSAPQDTRYHFEGHEIPLVFHFGGLTSVVMPEAISEVEYLSAGYGPEYSRALGGIINLKTREPEVKDRDQKWFFFADNLKTGGLIEKKIDENSSLLVSGRYSYIGLFLREALKDKEEFNLTVAPEFADLTVIYKKKFDELDSMKLSFLASRDTLEFLFKEPLREDPSVRGTFRNETSFYRIVPQFERKLGDEKLLRLSAAVGQDLLSVNAGQNYFEIRSLDLSVRGELENRYNESWKGQLGFDNDYSRSQVKLRLPYYLNQGGVANPVSTSSVREIDVNAKVSNIGLYSRNEYELPEGWTWLPNLRVDSFGLTKEYKVSPRLTVKKKIDESFLLKASSGIYYQPPRPQEASSEYGNPDIRSPEALHWMLGFEKDFRQGQSTGWQWSGQLFRRDFSRLVIESSETVTRDGVSTPEVYNNNGKGRAQGFETLIRYEMNPWTAWVSYTLSESKRWDDQRSEYPFSLDQTHNLNVVSSYEWTNNWKFSGRFRYVTGNPSTPVIGAVFDADNDVYIPIRGNLYSERRRSFQQLDFRADKKWIKDTSIWSFYIDIQNVLNIKNIEDERYSYNYDRREDVMGLPALPAIGVKGEF